MPQARPIVFVTDFGSGNEWVGMCHAVMTRIARDARIVNLSHFVRPLDVKSGARLLSDSLRFLPEDAILLAVVDPTVGKVRDIAVEAGDGRLLVGPDNGLLSMAWNESGGVVRAVEVTSHEVVILPVAPSLHARDVLCPAAAHLAAGMPLERLGRPIDRTDLAQITVTRPEVEPGTIRCEVIDHNRFGNVQLNVRVPEVALAGLDKSPDVQIDWAGGSVRARRGRTYADFEAGEYGVIFDPRGWLTIVRGNPGNALEELQLSVGDLISISGGAEPASASRE
jgi:S-adenosyl-L-methionine hydrolase (adenosine-forming)